MNHPGIQLYVGDALRESSFVGLSLAAQGLWIRMMMLMHDACKYGMLVNANGMQMSCKTLASVVGRPEQEIGELLAEMENLGTFSRLEDGTIYNRRMSKRGNISEKRSHAAKARWESEPASKGHAKRDANVHAKHAPSSSIFILQSSSSVKEPPISPPTGDAQKRQPRLDEEFEEIWPKAWLRVGKGAARRAYQQARKRNPRQVIEAALVAQGPRLLAEADEQQRNPLHVATWLNQERFFDEPPAPGQARASPKTTKQDLYLKMLDEMPLENLHADH